VLLLLFFDRNLLAVSALSFEWKCEREIIRYIMWCWMVSWKRVVFFIVWALPRNHPFTPHKSLIIHSLAWIKIQAYKRSFLLALGPLTHDQSRLIGLLFQWLSVCMVPARRKWSSHGKTHVQACYLCLVSLDSVFPWLPLSIGIERDHVLNTHNSLLDAH